MPSESPHSQPPFTSPNAIPPRTSSHGIINGIKSRSSILRPISEVDWLGKNKKSKLEHDTSPVPTKFMDPTTAQNLPAPSSVPLQNGVPKALGEHLVEGHVARWTDDKERILLGPYDYLLGHPGKDIRSQCIAAFNKWLKVPKDRLEVITRVVGMLHTASLLYASPISIFATQSKRAFKPTLAHCFLYHGN